MVGFGWSGPCICLLLCMGIEASLLASESLRKLRSAIRRVVWSRRQPLASVGAVLSLLDGPTGCDPAFFCVVWFMCCLLRRYLALWPAEVGRVYRLLAMVSEGCPGHGPIPLLSTSAAEIGFQWDPHALAWSRPRLARFSIPSMLFLMPGATRWLLIFVVGRVFVAGLCWTSMGLCSSFILLMFERDKALLRNVMVGGVWNGLLLGRVRGQAVPCRFCGAPDNDGHLFWECPFPPLVEIRDIPEFHDLMRFG